MCNGRSVVICEKCNVPLHVKSSTGEPCFKEYHTLPPE